jgi:hypothetical protein
MIRYAQHGILLKSQEPYHGGHLLKLRRDFVIFKSDINSSDVIAIVSMKKDF